MIDTVLPYILSVLTIITMVWAGRKDKNAWLLGIANQALWFMFIVRTESWGLLVLMIALLWVYSKNYLRWRREEQAA
jgi:hypothetical protein